MNIYVECAGVHSSPTSTLQLAVTLCCNCAMALLRLYQRGSTEQMSWNVTFLCKSCLNDITRWFMKFGAKRTTSVIWTEIQFKFCYWVSTLQATTPQPGPLFILKQDRRISIMIPNHPRVWKVYLVKVGFSPFWHPFCWFSLREMGQNRVSGQILLRFAPVLLQWYYILKCRRSIYQ